MSTQIRTRAARYAEDPAAQARWASGKQFAPVGPYARKVRCVTCGRTGYPGYPGPHPWQVSCLLGHAPCSVCGRQFVLTVAGEPRPYGHQRHVCRGVPSGTGWPA